MGTDGGLVLDPGVLAEDHVPLDLVGRADTVAEVLNGLTHAVVGNGHVWVYGPPGSGRTALARHAAARLPNATSVHVDCRVYRTAFLVLDELVKRLGLVGPDMQHTAAARLDTLRQRLGGHRVVLVLDDADDLSAHELHALLAAVTSLAGVTVIGTAQGIAPLTAELDQDVPCRFLPRLVAIDPLPAHELAAALLARARTALRPDALPADVADEIVRHARGDARFAFQVLRRAANLAEHEDRRCVSVDHVRGTVAELRESRRALALAKLTPHHRALLDAIVRAPGANAQEVRTAYLDALRALGSAPAAERTLRKYLNRDLPNRGLVRIERTGRRGNLLRYWPINGTSGMAAPGQPEG